MMDPVVSSKFGNRPLLDMPALHVESDSRVEISSLQPRRQDSLPSIIYRPEGVSQPQAPRMGGNGGLPPHPMSAPGALPPIQGGMYPSPPSYQQAPFHPGSMMPPMGPPMDPMQPSMMPMQSSMMPMQPSMMPMQPSMMPMQPPMMPMQQPPMGPAPMYQAMPYHRPGDYYGGGAGGGVPPPPMMPQYPHPPRGMPRSSVPANFHVEGVLQFGQLTTIHFRDKSSGSFQGIPDYLRMELMNTYGKYPVTDIRIVALNGQFHIYASPRKGGDDGDDYSEYGGDGGRRGGVSIGTPDSRMIKGFNEVRGEPRDLYTLRQRHT